MEEKDCVLYLHTALAPKQPLGAAIGYALVVQSEDINAQPVFKADAIKLVTTFRAQLPDDEISNREGAENSDWTRIKCDVCMFKAQESKKFWWCCC